MKAPRYSPAVRRELGRHRGTAKRADRAFRKVRRLTELRRKKGAENV